MPIFRRSVDQLLEERGSRNTLGVRLTGFGIAFLLHGLLIGGGIWKAFADGTNLPVEFVAVELLPASALGVESTAPPEPKSTPPPKPELELPPEPTPEPDPVADQPVITPEEEEPKPKKPDPPKPSPTETSPQTPGPEGTPGGSPTSLLKHGAAVAGFDNPNFNYGYYVDQMISLIRSQWTRPPLGSDIEVVIHFRIFKDGSVRNVEIRQSSGYNSFDLAGMRAVSSASPLPPLPRSFQDSSLGVNLIFR